MLNRGSMEIASKLVGVFSGRGRDRWDVTCLVLPELLRAAELRSRPDKAKLSSRRHQAPRASVHIFLSPFSVLGTFPHRQFSSLKLSQISDSALLVQYLHTLDPDPSWRSSIASTVSREVLRGYLALRTLSKLSTVSHTTSQSTLLFSCAPTKRSEAQCPCWKALVAFDSDCCPIQQCPLKAHRRGLRITRNMPAHQQMCLRKRRRKTTSVSEHRYQT